MVWPPCLPSAPVPFRPLAEGAPARHCINSKPQGVTELMTGFIVAFINQKRTRKVENEKLRCLGHMC
jgi:hypothetical protein